MRKLIVWLPILIGIFQVIGCLPKGSENNISLNKIVVKTNVSQIDNDSDLSAQQKAEAIAQEAEKLMTASGFMFANELVNKALSYDSTNFRAQLLGALLSPEMKMQGVLKRSSTIFSHTKSGKELRERIGQTLGRNDSLKTFLNNAESYDIKTEKDVQSLLGSIQQERENLRVFLSKNKDKKITLNVPILTSNKVKVVTRVNFVEGTDTLLEIKTATDSDQEKFESISNWEYITTNLMYMRSMIYTYCTTRIANDGEYETACNESINYEQKPVTLVRPDFEAAEQVAAGAVIQMIIANAYNTEGAISVLEEFKDEDSSALAREIKKRNDAYDKYNSTDHYSHDVFARRSALDLISEKQNLGKGLNLKDLEYINTLGANAIPAIRIALQNQKRWCPAGQFQNQQREGYLLARGACLSSTLAGNIISDIEEGLSGKDSKFKVYNNKEDSFVDVAVNSQKFIGGSLNDLQSLKASFDDFGRIQFEDQSASGVITSDNLNEIVKALSNKTENQQHLYEVEKK